MILLGSLAIGQDLHNAATLCGILAQFQDCNFLSFLLQNLLTL